MIRDTYGINEETRQDRVPLVIFCGFRVTKYFLEIAYTK